MCSRVGGGCVVGWRWGCSGVEVGVCVCSGVEMGVCV